jgi:predicted adenylyl cyclase CyaB
LPQSPKKGVADCHTIRGWQTGGARLARNVEIKARLANYQTQFDLARKLSGEPGERIHQTDIFFLCDNGRLKLRVFDDGHGELIFYQRANETGPKLSDYVLSRIDDPESLREALSKAYGVLAIVVKERMLFLHGRTRIHLDQVEDLGSFLELEVVLDEQEEAAAGRQEAESLMAQLRIESDALVDRAYVDLLLERGKK